MKKRMGVFVFYDAEGKVDRYVEYLLQEMCKELQKLVIVCNGYVCKMGIEILHQYTNDIFIRENVGFDAGAYKYIFLDKDYIHNLIEYDELVLFNDTCYGPFFPMREVFNFMDEKKVDFWGLTQYKDYLVKQHIQSYFLVFERVVFTSKSFLEFWENCDTNTTIVGNVISEFETQLTKYLSDKGFRWDTYIKCEEYFNLNPYFYFSDKLIKKDHFPFLKKRRFKYKTINQSLDKDLMMALDYVKNYTNYPVEYIYENAIRCNDVFDLRETLNLNYVLPYECEYAGSRDYSAAVFIHLFYEDIVDEAIDYISNIPAFIDIYITTSVDSLISILNQKLSQLPNKLKITKVDNRGRDISALLIADKNDALKYKYICFIHDKKTRGRVQAEDVRYLMWDNLLKSKEYIQNILYTLEKDEFLGFLSAPYPYHGDLISVIANGSGASKEKVQEQMGRLINVLEMIDVESKVNKDSIPIALSTAFWCKVDAIQQIFKYDFSYDDFPYDKILPEDCLSYSIELIFPYVAQSNGYYSGQVENTQFASLSLINYEDIIRKVMQDKNTFNAYFLNLENSPQKNIEEFYINNKDKEVYIYGTGLFGNSVYGLLKGKKIAGYVVSDTFYREPYFKDIKIYKISSVIKEKNIAIIVAMDRKNSEDVKGLLANVSNVLYIW